jgi:hypothetical protein
VFCCWVPGGDIPGDLVGDKLFFWGHTAWNDSQYSCFGVHERFGALVDLLFDSSQMLFKILDPFLGLKLFAFKEQIFQVIRTDYKMFPCRNLIS